MQTNELYVGNLDRNVKPEELKDIFQMYGNIKRCVVKVGDTSKITQHIYQIFLDYIGFNSLLAHTASYGFVMFESAAEAEFAKEQTNGLNLHGRRMIIQFSKTKPGKDRRLERFIGLELAENQINNEHDRDRRRRRRSPSYSRRTSRNQNSSDDDRHHHRKRSRSRSSSKHKSSSKRSRLPTKDDEHRTSHSSQHRNSKRH